MTYTMSGEVLSLRLFRLLVKRLRAKVATSLGLDATHLAVALQ